MVLGAVIDGQRVAIDVGLTSQARRTPQDLVHQYAFDKVHKYGRLIEGEMRRAGLVFRAAIWSQEGRPGRDAREVVDGLTNMAHKHQPGTIKTDIRQRLTHEIAVQCQIRLANLVNAGLPTPTGQSAWICLGLDTNSPDHITQASNEDHPDAHL